MTLFITGSESFVGRELIGHCRDRGFDFVGVDAEPTEDADSRQADIRSAEIADLIPESADAIVHLAAISRHGDCRDDPATAFDVNVGGTLNLIEAAKARNVKQFIFASSEWVYGGSPGDGVRTEESVIDANLLTSEYALTKIAGERLLFTAHERGLCPVTILRFGIIYGPRPKPMSAVEGLFHEVGTQDVVEVTCSLDSGRRFIHVSDIADGILAALGREGFEVFNISGNTLITFGQVIEESSRILQKNPRVEVKNGNVLNVRHPDNQKARRLLPWKPEIDLPSGLRSLLEFHADEESPDG
ncbi:MAG: NAD(P)-dependent oxidoreductase [Lentisphaerae bacterium]|nr:NAD(P)-dependent oxidoreductase [Lentisphaerota bacterium]